MKFRVLLMLMLSACVSPDNGDDYALTWNCLTPEGCERTEEVAMLDRMNIKYVDVYVTSTRDETYGEFAELHGSDSLPVGCSWLVAFTLFGSELEPARWCRTPGGFELNLSIPNADLMTSSKWFVRGREI